MFKVSGKKRVNQRPWFPSTKMNKINKNSQIIETIFMMRFTEAAIIGSLWVSVFPVRMIQKPQACNRLKVTAKQTAGLLLCTVAVILILCFMNIQC